MVREIVTYPTTPSLEFGANVRFFNEELFSIIEDLKDTLEENKLNALSAFQVGSSLSVVVIKKDAFGLDDDQGEYLELVNPRVLKREGTVTPIETTAYFPGMSAKTTRYEKIKLMYEDRDGNQQFLEADGDLSTTIQRKIDYMFGSNFRVRLEEDERKLFDSKLEFGTDAITQNDCPTVFKRDRILQAFKLLFIVGIFGVISSFFIADEAITTLQMVENYILLSMAVITVVYFFYAQYEGKQYKHCTSCQIGNIIGTSIFLMIKLVALSIASYFII
ncbi:peptide deformylase [Candidatus Sulfurimonas marisnigri]|uniref:Peptide deformylase n=1 Tax=Candidatus Sulfurimonas marisnigri TaxID=2740405 RepID=A0A7S7M0C0_9BACT|nr:peptide deformylase [Candidatus Sulfurimonas marisnigri]QOY54684.1 peptide deformylase [Candidatus Sulfurimonas marisnigri]